MKQRITGILAVAFLMPGARAFADSPVPSDIAQSQIQINALRSTVLTMEGLITIRAQGAARPDQADRASAAVEELDRDLDALKTEFQKAPAGRDKDVVNGRLSLAQIQIDVLRSIALDMEGAGAWGAADILRCVDNLERFLRDIQVHAADAADKTAPALRGASLKRVDDAARLGEAMARSLAK